MKKLIRYLNETIKKEKHLLRFIIILFLIGMIIGSLFINFISKDDKVLLTNQVTTFFSSVKNLSSDIFGFNVFKENLISNTAWLIIIFILGLSVIGVLGIIFIMFYKGFMLSVTLSSILIKYKIKGILGIILYVFPMQIINILIYVFLSFFAINTSIKFIKAFIKKDNLNFKTFLGKYLLSFIISIILIIICTLIDSYLTPLLLKLFTSII